MATPCTKCGRTDRDTRAGLCDVCAFPEKHAASKGKPAVQAKPPIIRKGAALQRAQLRAKVLAG